MTIYGESCSVLYWLFERVKISSKIFPQFENCCKQRSVVLKPSKDQLEFLHYLFESDNVQSKHFPKNICQYNLALALTSLKYQLDSRLGPGGYKCFSIYR